MAKYTQDATPRGANKIVSSLSANLLILFFGDCVRLRMSFGDIIGKWLMDKLLLLLRLLLFLIFVSLFPGILRRSTFVYYYFYFVSFADSAKWEEEEGNYGIII